jgi:glycosyltransferase involved in cell wall biosynthesis
MYVSEEVTFNVLVPTRNRATTLLHCLRTCCNQDYDGLSIVVSDNCSDDQTRQVVESFADSRLRYIRAPRPLSMSGNFDFALTAVESGYVMFLGDDDGLLPGAVRRCAELVKKWRVSAVVSAHAPYFWPDALNVNRRNSLLFRPSGRDVVRHVSDSIRRVLNGRASYTELPGLYSGFVSFDVISRCIRDGRFFHSVTPDAYSAFACSAKLNKYVYCERAFSLAGISGRSNGASQLSLEVSGESSRYEAENDIAIHRRMRYCRNIDMIMIEAFLQAQDRFDELKAFDVPLHAAMRRALVEVPPESFARLEDELLAIAKLNSISMRRTQRKPFRFRVSCFLKLLQRGVRRVVNGDVLVDCRAFRIDSVSGAVVLAGWVGEFYALGYRSFVGRGRGWWRLIRNMAGRGRVLRRN